MAPPNDPPPSPTDRAPPAAIATPPPGAAPAAAPAALWQRHDHFAGWPAGLTPMLDWPGINTRVDRVAPQALPSLDAVARCSAALLHARQQAPLAFDACLGEDVELTLQADADGAPQADGATLAARLFRPLEDHELTVCLHISPAGQPEWQIGLDGELVAIGTAPAGGAATWPVPGQGVPGSAAPLSWLCSDDIAPTDPSCALADGQGWAWTWAALGATLDEAAETLGRLVEVTQSPPYLAMARAEG